MRTITTELLRKLENNEFYRFIVDMPQPDRSKLEREALAFGKWIAREHEKERVILRRLSSHV